VIRVVAKEWNRRGGRGGRGGGSTAIARHSVPMFYIVEGCTLIWRELGEALGLIFLLSWSVAKIPSIG